MRAGKETRTPPLIFICIYYIYKCIDLRQKGWGGGSSGGSGGALTIGRRR